MADEDENAQQTLRRSARIRKQTRLNYAEIDGNRPSKPRTAQRNRRPLVTRNNQAPEVQISSNQAPAANQIETSLVRASNVTSSQNVPTTSSNQNEAPSIRTYSGLVSRSNDLQPNVSDSSQTSTSDSSLQNSPILLHTMPSTSNVEPWTAIGISREEYEQAIQAERQWEQVRTDENFARNVQLENVEQANDEFVVPRVIQPEPVSFQPALNLLLPIFAPTEEPQQSSSAKSSQVVEEEPPECVICHDDEIKSPTSCVYCKQIIGCFECANNWFNTIKQSNIGQSPTCPLCRHIWDAQSYKTVSDPAPTLSKKRGAKDSPKKVTIKRART